jgi:integrase
MSAKVINQRGAWWLRTHFAGKKHERRFGPTKADKQKADKVAEKINAKIALGEYEPSKVRERPLPCSSQLREWLKAYGPTLKPTTAKLFDGFIGNHLCPHFGEQDLRDLREQDLVRFVGVMQSKGRAPGTIKNALSFLRLVCNSLIRNELLVKNPASHLGRIMRSVQNAAAKETIAREAWSRSEAANLIEVARAREPRFAFFVELLFATGMRRGEALGLQWTDIDFDRQRITIRRSITSQGMSTPKSGKSRIVVMTAALAGCLFDLQTELHRDRLKRGWPDLPPWVFCSEAGTAPDPRNVERVWARVRRRAQKLGVRPLPLHSARHSWATWALQAGKSVRWVADQLGHADASTTLNHYAHAMPEDAADLSFLDLGVAKRHQPSPVSGEEPSAKSEIDIDDWNGRGNLERETRLELATLSLGS